MKPKSKCCKKFKRKSRACKRCPLLAAVASGHHHRSRKALKKLRAL